MRMARIALCCVFAAFCTACLSATTGQSGPRPATSPGAPSVERDGLADVAARLTAALGDRCVCPSASDRSGTGLRVCGYPITIEKGAALEASTNGHRIRITSAMLEFFASEDELAFVVAHELSHILLGHAGAFNGLSPGAVEIEADRLGIRIVSRADFDTGVAAKFPERMALSYPEMNRLGGAYLRPAVRTAMIGAALRDESGPRIDAGPRGECAE